jgi:hypothetical protein
VDNDAVFDSKDRYNFSAGQSNFPTEFFLDLEFFSPLPHRTLIHPAGVPLQVRGCLGTDIISLCAGYYRGVHTWLPIISQKRLYQAVSEYDEETDASLALLLMCAKLVSQPSLDEQTDALYRVSKGYFNSVEESGSISLLLLQSAVLIAVYEIGNGISPAAYLTIGRAARLAVLMGLNDRKMTQLFKPADTWTLREEERRTWWAVFILERYVNITPIGLPMGTPQPTWETLLPISDSRWNDGDISPSEALFTSGFLSASNIGPYARLCQASHVLSNVLVHRNDRPAKAEDRSVPLGEAIRIETTLTSLDNHLIQQLDASSSSWSAAVDVAVCSSARMTFWDLYGCNEPDATQDSQGRLAMETQLQTSALEGLKKIPVDRTMRIAQDIRQLDDTGLGRLSPLVIECLYHAATECKWFIRENYDIGMVLALQAITQALQHIDKRWKVAGSYSL